MKFHSLAISGLMTLDLHSLNNEGAEGNHLQTRMVEIVDEEGELHSVNAISGDMFKHIQAEHFYFLSKEGGLPLCEGCAVFDPNRINADDAFAEAFKDKATNEEILTKTLERCAGDDAEGILITKELGGAKRAIGRKSVLEFGWVVGRPEKTRTESYFHVKYDRRERGKGAGDDTGANVGQNIFHRPASSGQYAVVLNLDLYRVGRNDISLAYAIDREERRRRIRALLKSVLFTFLKPNGAHRNTQNPHLVAFEGCIAASTATIPAPMVSALNSRYQNEIKGIAGSLNRLAPGAANLLPFASLSEFADHMVTLADKAEPYGED